MTITEREIDYLMLIDDLRSADLGMPLTPNVEVSPEMMAAGVSAYYDAPSDGGQFPDIPAQVLRIYVAMMRVHVRKTAPACSAVVAGQ